MNNEELLRKINRVKNNLEYAKRQLKNSQDILNDSITFDNEIFKKDDITKINNKLSNQINNINNKIIPNINSM